eukprot:scaffold90697_cov31-Tisochrysis_lutea.AAC.5
MRWKRAWRSPNYYEHACVSAAAQWPGDSTGSHPGSDPSLSGRYRDCLERRSVVARSPAPACTYRRQVIASPSHSTQRRDLHGQEHNAADRL